MSQVIRHQLDELHERVDDVLAEIKPKLRGWLHLATAPLAVGAGIVLIALSPDAPTRWGSSIYAMSAVLLFTVSAIYHRGSWGPKTRGFLMRFDHANIFLLIAGTYTPLSLILLEGRERAIMLASVWTVALLGCVFRILWTSAPRWLYTSIYIGLGWAAVMYGGSFLTGAESLGLGVGTVVLALIAAGGLLYTAGGLVYGLKRPDPWPSWFGFHEVFHTFTILAFTCHYVGVSVATYSLR